MKKAFHLKVVLHAFNLELFQDRILRLKRPSSSLVIYYTYLESNKQPQHLSEIIQDIRCPTFVPSSFQQFRPVHIYGTFLELGSESVLYVQFSWVLACLPCLSRTCFIVNSGRDIKKSIHHQLVWHFFATISKPKVIIVVLGSTTHVLLTILVLYF